jgi:hypothetical protein
MRHGIYSAVQRREKKKGPRHVDDMSWAIGKLSFLFLQKAGLPSQQRQTIRPRISQTASTPARLYATEAKGATSS